MFYVIICYYDTLRSICYTVYVLTSSTQYMCYVLSSTQYIIMISSTQYMTHNLVRSIMHNVYMQAVCNHMNLVRIPRRDHMYLACYVLHSR